MFEALRYSLKHNRKGVVKSATAWFLFGAIILVFVFWGLTPQQPGVAEGGAAAIVNDQTISLARLQEAVESMRRDPRYQQFESLGGDMGRQIFQQQALQQLIDMELIRQEADNRHLMATDAEVRDLIVGIPQFQEDGRFKRDLYMGYLQAVRKTPAEFEEDVRREQVWRRTMRMFNSALKPLPMESGKQKSLREMKANLEILKVPTETLVKPERITAAQIDGFLAETEASQKVRAYYDSHRDEFSTPEQVKARHILIQAPEGDVEAQKRALAKIEKIASEATTGNFAKLAETHSEDPGSKAKGGLIDFFGRGQMVPEFEKAAFSADINQITAPVKTSYGYHLIYVLDKKEAEVKSVEQVQRDIARTLIAQEQSKKQFEALQSAVKRGDLAEVNMLARNLGLEWSETGEFSIETDSVPQIGQSEDAVRAAFSLSSGSPLWKELIRQGATAYVLRYEPVSPSPAKTETARVHGAEVDSDLVSDMMTERRGGEAWQKWVNSLRAEATISRNTQVFGASN